MKQTLKSILAIAFISGMASQANAQKMNEVPIVKLNNGVEMPQLGFGSLRLPQETCAENVANAIRLGFRLIDAAKNYANEEEVGRGIKMSGVPREQLFITTKLWIKDYGYERAKQAFEASLDRLGTDYIDLYLLHQPFGDVHGAWRALEELYEEGKIRAIGVSNFSPDRLVDLCQTARIRPMVNQIEFSPYFQQWRAKQWNDKYGVQVEAWGAMVSGNHPELFTEPTLVEIGAKYKKSAAQVILRYLTQRGIVALCRTDNPKHQQEDISIFDFELTDAEMHAIDLLDKGRTMAKDHRSPEDVEWFHTQATR